MPCGSPDGYWIELVRRNPINARLVQSWLPYELLLEVICNTRMKEDEVGGANKLLLPTCSMFVQLVRDLWVEAVPHEPMVYVKHVRKWGYVEEAAKSGKLSS